jgi:hypothetical protein
MKKAGLSPASKLDPKCPRRFGYRHFDLRSNVYAYPL